LCTRPALTSLENYKIRILFVTLANDSWLILKGTSLAQYGLYVNFLLHNRELIKVSVTEKDIRKVLLKHPWLPYDYAKRIAEDLKRKNTTVGLKAYNREYGRLRRVEKRGDKKALSDVAGVVSGKYLKKKRKKEG